jgi:hypothetical protein
MYVCHIFYTSYLYTTISPGYPCHNTIFTSCCFDQVFWLPFFIDVWQLFTCFIFEIRPDYVYSHIFVDFVKSDKHMDFDDIIEIGPKKLLKPLANVPNAPKKVKKPAVVEEDEDTEMIDVVVEKPKPKKVAKPNVKEAPKPKPKPAPVVEEEEEEEEKEEKEEDDEKEEEQEAEKPDDDTPPVVKVRKVGEGVPVPTKHAKKHAEKDDDDEEEKAERTHKHREKKHAKAEDGEGKKKTKRPRVHREKDPNFPKRPKNGYLRFCDDIRPKIIEACKGEDGKPKLSRQETMKIVGQKWRELAEKRPALHKSYNDAFEVDMKKWRIERDAYLKTKAEAGGAAQSSSSTAPVKVPKPKPKPAPVEDDEEEKAEEEAEPEPASDVCEEDAADDE